VVCIHVPISEMSCPLKKSWKLRWRNARKVLGIPVPRDAAPFRIWPSVLAVVGGLRKPNLSTCS
jgi:hypothetical protein